MLKGVLSLIEPLLLAGMLLAFWYASPPRDQWLWLLGIVPIIWVVRWLVYRRLWTRTPLDYFLIIFVVLGIFNMYAAPYRRSADIPYSFFILMGRPLMGIALYGYFVERVRQRGGMDSLLAATLALGAIISVLALGASQWNSKSVSLEFVIDRLPRIADSLTAFDAGGGFNSNEIAGALAFFCPLLGGLIAFRWRRYNLSLRIITTILFTLLFVALFLGQSRFALAGTLVSLVMLVGLLVPRQRWRWLAWGALLAIAVLEIMIVRDVFVPPEQQVLAARDEESNQGRLDIWESALHIMRDYPLTGVGLNMFRDGRVRAIYPVPSFKNPVLPHTHQEWLQFGTDMGLPGLVLWIGLQVMVVYQLVKGYRGGNSDVKAVTAALAAGLFAHGFFGLGDAITIWDRFAFLLWWLLGLAGAQTFLVSEKNQL